MAYTHVQIEVAQRPKRPGSPCGDVVLFERSHAATTIICADGLGSGVKANIAATICSARLMELLRNNFSLRDAFRSLVKTMNDAREADLPFAAFVVARILNDGTAGILTYEMPPPLLVGSNHSELLPQQIFTLEHALLGESHCQLAPGEGLLITSDGITQAGLGNRIPGMPEGWTSVGLNRFVAARLGEGLPAERLPGEVMRRAGELWRTAAGDDCTVLVAMCRTGRTLNILTGPPSDPARDAEVVARFASTQGEKVICGGTTAKIVSHRIGRKLSVKQDFDGIAPPEYSIPGFELVTEGAVTLNQVYNLLDADPLLFEESSAVTELLRLLHSADRINIIIGGGVNPASDHISFKQQGIIARERIIPLIADKLRAMGKLIVIEKV